MKNSTVLITGVTGGIGSVIAERFMEAGYTVLGTASKSSPPRELSEKNNFSFGSRWGVGSAKAHAYASSKAALKGPVTSFQQENISNGIRHILLSPGSVLTDMSRSVDSKVGEEILDPSDIAECLLYLASTRPNMIFEEITMKACPYDYEH